MRFIKFFVIFVVFLVFACAQKGDNQIQNQASNQEIPSQNQLEDNQSLAQKKQYIFGTDDIPLFDGLILLEEESSNFDTMTGNIVISKYTSNSKEKSIKDFYNNTLPQLGWRLSKSTNDKILFIREKERLEISIKSINKILFVRFFILSEI